MFVSHTQRLNPEKRLWVVRPFFCMPQLLTFENSPPSQAMPPPPGEPWSSALPSNQPLTRLRWRTRRLMVLVMLFTALAAGVLWWQAERSREQLRRQVMLQAEQRSMHLADAMAGRVMSLLGMFDLALRDLRREWGRDRALFDPIVRQVMDTFAPDLVAHTTVVDADGAVVYSSLGPESRALVGDRPHFQAHKSGLDRLLVGKPETLPAFEGWTFEVSRPLLRDGRFEGAIQMMISTEGLSRKLASLQLSERDVVALIHTDGTYMSRSLRNTEAMGTKAPLDVASFGDATSDRGLFRVGGGLDGIERTYGWQHMAPYPLVMAIGLSDASVLAPLAPAFARSRVVTGILTALLFLCGGLVSALLWRVERQQAKVEDQESFRQRLFESSTVPTVVMDATTATVIDCNPAAVHIYGFPERASVIGSTPADFSPPVQHDGTPSAEKSLEHIRQAIDQGSAVFEWLHQRPDGTLWDAEVRLMGFASKGRWLLQYTLQDITDRRKAEAALKESEARLKEAQKLARIGNWEMDATSRRIVWSDELYRIFEVSQGEFLPCYANIIAIVHPEDREAFTGVYAASMTKRRPYDLVHRLRMRDGRIKHVRNTGLSEFNGDRVVRSLGTVQDITEVRMAEEKLQRLNEELEQRVAERTREMTVLNRDLEAFSYSVSHDLRTPLRSIDGYASLLAADWGAHLDDEGRSHLERIRQSARRMGYLINDMLTMARLNRTDLRHEKVDLSEMARAVLAELESGETQRLVTWHIEDGLVVQADAGLMRAVLQNLLGNAWKYTGHTPDARISLTRELRADGVAEYRVRDNGAGFDMAYADQLFQPFRRLHAHHEFEGTGVGLATVHRIIERHGGQVRGEGRVGEGAVFCFTLPGAATHSA
jgi:PAS domain S-box-containing protein